MIGAVIILFVLFVIGPIGLFIVAGGWSALQAWLQTETAEERSTGAENAPSETPH
ncbi:MAG TPA: hypothetical protein VL856_14770 [Acidimicrobiia bacterium]|nr:hypothetical protein [Acidimicrobiia bacterium]